MNNNISEKDLSNNEKDLSNNTENNTKENTEIKSPNTSEIKEIPYPRKRKFKNSREIEKYLLTTYYKHYAEEDDLPNYLIRDIILYKLSSFKLFTPIDSKDILGKPNEYGTVLYFNTLLQKELEFQREIQDVLESEISTKELSNEDRKKIEDLNNNLDKLIKSVRDAYTQAKNLYKITKREEDRRRN